MPEYQLSPDAFGPVVRAQAHRRRAEDGEVAHGAAAGGPHVLVVRIREAQAVAGGGGDGDHGQLALGRDVAERVQEERVHPAEDHGVGGHAEAERQGGERREQRPADEQADGVAQIGQQHVESPDAKAKPGRVGPGSGAAAQQRPAGRRGRQTSPFKGQPVVGEIAFPLSPAAAAFVGRREVGAQPDHDQRDAQPGRRLGHDSTLTRTGRKTL